MSFLGAFGELEVDKFLQVRVKGIGGRAFTIKHCDDGGVFGFIVVCADYVIAVG